jgi:hypothetical protein
MACPQFGIGAHRRQFRMPAQGVPLLSQEGEGVTPLARRRVTAGLLEQRVDTGQQHHAGARQYASA